MLLQGGQPETTPAGDNDRGRRCGLKGLSAPKPDTLCAPFPPSTPNSSLFPLPTLQRKNSKSILTKPIYALPFPTPSHLHWVSPLYLGSYYSPSLVQTDLNLPHSTLQISFFWIANTYTALNIY